MITLLYHEISDKPHWLIDRFDITIHPKVFEMQMKVVRDYDVLLTFDDGYRSAVQIAGDILLKYKLNSIWNINSGFWDNEKVFWLSKLMWLCPNLSPESEKCTYSRGLEVFLSERFFDDYAIAQKAQLYASPSELKTLNAEIGNHTALHLNIRNISLVNFIREVSKCQEDVLYRMERLCRNFAFPFGEYPVHWDLACVEALTGFPFKRIFSVDSEEIHGVLPRHIVPVNLDSESGFKAYLEELCIKQGL